MSSSNAVRVTIIEETSPGVTPGIGNFETVRFTSESLSGTPTTSESSQIRVDRLSSGTIVTGLSVEGSLSFELAKEGVVDMLIEGAMLSDWATTAIDNVDLSINTVAKTLTRASGSYALAVGDFITLSGFVNAANNVQVIVTELVSNTVVKYAGPLAMVTEVGTGTGFKKADKISIGTTKKSYSLEKNFTDLTTKAINYVGMNVTTMDLSVAYGEIITGSFNFSGMGFEPVDAAVDFMTNGRTINGAATTNSLNGSIDMPMLASSATGVLDSVDFCIQSVSFNLNNNPTNQNCIGKIAPTAINMGTATVGIELTAYLSDSTWAILNKKLTQESFSLAFQVKNGDGWYGFYIPALQVSFSDPSSGGANQDTMLSMSGSAKVGASGESSLFIFKS